MNSDNKEKGLIQKRFHSLDMFSWIKFFVNIIKNYNKY